MYHIKFTQRHTTVNFTTKKSGKSRNWNDIIKQGLNGTGKKQESIQLTEKTSIKV